MNSINKNQHTQTIKLLLQYSVIYSDKLFLTSLATKQLIFEEKGGVAPYRKHVLTGEMMLSTWKRATTCITSTVNLDDAWDASKIGR